MSDQSQSPFPSPPPFPLLRYLSLVLLFAPLALTALIWVGLVLSAYFHGPSFGALKETGAGWLTMAVAAGVVCVLCEWLVLPLVLPRQAMRPAFTPLVSFGVVLAVAAACWLALEVWF